MDGWIHIHQPCKMTCINTVDMSKVTLPTLLRKYLSSESLHGILSLIPMSPQIHQLGTHMAYSVLGRT